MASVGLEHKTPTWSVEGGGGRGGLQIAYSKKSVPLTYDYKSRKVEKKPRNLKRISFAEDCAGVSQTLGNPFCLKCSSLAIRRRLCRNERLPWASLVTDVSARLGGAARGTTSVWH